MTHEISREELKAESRFYANLADNIRAESRHYAGLADKYRMALRLAISIINEKPLRQIGTKDIERFVQAAKALGVE